MPLHIPDKNYYDEKYPHMRYTFRTPHGYYGTMYSIPVHMLAEMYKARLGESPKSFFDCGAASGKGSAAGGDAFMVLSTLPGAHGRLRTPSAWWTPRRAPGRTDRGPDQSEAFPAGGTGGGGGGSAGPSAYGLNPSYGRSSAGAAR